MAIGGKDGRLRESDTCLGGDCILCHSWGYFCVAADGDDACYDGGSVPSAFGVGWVACLLDSVVVIGAACFVEIERVGDEMNTENMIEITGCDLRVLVRTAYNLSVSLGMGHLHFRPGELDEETVYDIVNQKESMDTVLGMDYVHGRSVKLTVHKDGDRLYIHNAWFDHTPRQLQALLQAIGVKEAGVT